MVSALPLAGSSTTAGTSFDTRQFVHELSCADKSDVEERMKPCEVNVKATGKPSPAFVPEKV